MHASPFIATLLAGILTIALAACGGGDGGGTDTPTDPGISIQPVDQSMGVVAITPQPAEQMLTSGGTAGTDSSVSVGGTAGTDSSVSVGGTAGTDSSVSVGGTAGTDSSVSVGGTAGTGTGTGTSVSVGGTADTGTSSTTSSTTSSVFGTAAATAGAIASSNAPPAVNVTVAPTLTTQPTAQTITAGQSATFSVAATGTSPNYQWKRNGSDISGATSSSYTTPAMSIAGSGVVYSVEVSNSAGTVTSTNATLTVNKSSNTPSYSLVTNASGGSYDKSECVNDSSTGFVWEGKTASGIRAESSRYTNYDSTSRPQKNYVNFYGVNPTQEELEASTNSIGYVKIVNDMALCGFTDWRMPTKEELQGITDSSKFVEDYPAIVVFDATWLINTGNTKYWTSSPDYDQPSSAYIVEFYDGYYYTDWGRHDTFSVRLVRGIQ